MTTIGELDAIVQELHLVDIGDAASYLGEEAGVVMELLMFGETEYGRMVDERHDVIGEPISYQRLDD